MTNRQRAQVVELLRCAADNLTPTSRGAWTEALDGVEATDRQLLAGEKLRSDYEAAMMGPQVAMRWENVPLSREKRSAPSGLSQTERTISAKKRFDDALVALGPDLSDIAWRVICAGEAMPVAEREMAWPVRSGKLVLRIALDRLAGFYRLPG